MSLKDKLQLILITYNRKNHLQKTFDQIFAESSPIKDFDITILDNASTDGTSELIDNYCEKFSNLNHVRRKVNIGGNANICRAFELGAVCGKEYFWILCDDDKYDFSNWHEVKENIENGVDIICVADYAFKQGEKESKASQIFQLTFVPAGIYKASIITDGILTNMYDMIYTSFQQSVPVIKVINDGGKIHVLSKPIVFNGIHFEDKAKDLSLTRGYNDKFLSKRQKVRSWVLGFSNVITLLNDTDMQKECMHVAILYKDIYACRENFYQSIVQQYMNFKNISYFIEVYEVLPNDLKQYIDLNNTLILASGYKNFVVGVNNAIPKPTFLQQIFSITNENNHKVIRILGIKIKLK